MIRRLAATTGDRSRNGAEAAFLQSGIRGRGQELAHAVLVNLKHWGRAPYLSVWRQRQRAIVQDNPGAVDPHRHNRVILADVDVADDNELNVLRRDAGCSERHIFGERNPRSRRGGL